MLSYEDDLLVGLTIYQTQRLNDMNGVIRSVGWGPPVDHFIMVMEITCDETMLSRLRRDLMRNCIGYIPVYERPAILS